MQLPQHMDVPNQVDVLVATRIVTEHRIGRFPIPTNRSHLYENSESDLAGAFRHLTAILSPIEDRTLLTGVFYEWMYRGDIKLQSLLELDDLFKEVGFRFVLVPFVTSMNIPADWFERCSTVRCVQLRDPKYSPMISSDYFHYDRSWARNQKVLNESNVLSSQIYQQLKKLSHIMLSDEAAPSYDAEYGKATFGTSTYMALENSVLKAQIEKCVKFDHAIELGCGTGRHTFELAERFTSVDGYDFSAQMIATAAARRDKKHESNTRRLLPTLNRLKFHTRDIEMFPPDHAQVDLVAGLFGMGSFVEDVDALLAHCYAALAPGGRVILSFYNREAAVYSQPPPWRFSALSAELAGDADELIVSLNPKTAFRIYCKAWTPDAIREKMKVYFQDVECLTIPKAAGVFPIDYPTSDSPLAVDLTRIERGVLFDESFKLGPYILASGRKVSDDIKAVYFDSSASAIGDLKRSIAGGMAKKVSSFWEDRQVGAGGSTGVNVQPILGYASAGAGSLRDLPIVILRPWDQRLARNEINALLRPIFGKSRVFEFAESSVVRAAFGDGPEAVPSGVLKSNVIVGIHPSLHDGGPYRLKVRDQVVQVTSFEQLVEIVGGRLVRAAGMGGHPDGGGAE